MRLRDPRTAFETCSLAVVEDVLLLLVVLKSNATSMYIHVYSRFGTPLLLRKVALLRRRTCWHRAAARRGVHHSFWQRRMRGGCGGDGGAHFGDGHGGAPGPREALK